MAVRYGIPVQVAGDGPVPLGPGDVAPDEEGVMMLESWNVVVCDVHTIASSTCHTSLGVVFREEVSD